MKSKYYFVPNKNAELVIEGAKTLNQLNSNFSRLYNCTKDLDNLMRRERHLETNRLKPRGVVFYPAPNSTPEGIICEIVDIHGKKAFYVLCSGGKDSISVVHWIAQNYPEYFKGVMHIKTNVGIKKTTEWLKEYCKEMNWPLIIREPDPPDVYRDIVMRWGFPGPGLHTVVMRLLKLFVMRRFAFENENRKENHCLLGGIRQYESVRRMGNYQSPIFRDGKLWFGSPFFNLSDEWVYKYLLTNGLKKTPVHDVLGMSGECECGSFARLGEREKIRILDPNLDAYLSELERDVLIYGTEMAKKRPIWGKGETTPEEAKKITEEVYGKLDPDYIEELEKIVCGVECGLGTMKEYITNPLNPDRV